MVTESNITNYARVLAYDRYSNPLLHGPLEKIGLACYEMKVMAPQRIDLHMDSLGEALSMYQGNLYLALPKVVAKHNEAVRDPSSPLMHYICSAGNGKDPLPEVCRQIRNGSDSDLDQILDALTVSKDPVTVGSSS